MSTFSISLTVSPKFTRGCSPGPAVDGVDRIPRRRSKWVFSPRGFPTASKRAGVIKRRRRMRKATRTKAVMRRMPAMVITMDRTSSAGVESPARDGGVGVVCVEVCAEMSVHVFRCDCKEYCRTQSVLPSVWRTVRSYAGSSGITARTSNLRKPSRSQARINGPELAEAGRAPPRISMIVVAKEVVVVGRVLVRALRILRGGSGKRQLSRDRTPAPTCVYHIPATHVQTRK